MITNSRLRNTFLIWTLGILSFLSMGSLWAADPSVTLRAPQVVEVGERFELAIVINARASNVTPPPLNGFRLLGGPSTSQSSSFSMVNGKTTQSVETSYSYYVEATQTGSFTLQPAKAVVDGKEYYSATHTIEVVAGSRGSNAGATGATGANGNPSATANSASATQGGSTLYLKILPAKQTLYQGEALPVSLKIFTRERLVSLGNLLFPDLAGFYRQDIAIPPLESLERENVGGIVYNTGVLASLVLFPQKSGELQIGTFTVDCGIQEAGQGYTGSLFDDFFGSQRTIQRTIASTPANLTVIPLPSGAPEGFSGAVGNYQLSVQADKLQLKAHEAFTLTVEIRGEGNIKLIDAPVVSLPSEFERYDPKITASVGASGVSGLKKFEYLIIPRQTGTFSIPPVQFSYFNPQTKQYATVYSQPLQIEVMPGEEGSQVVSGNGLPGQSVQSLGKDIRFIKTGRPDFFKADSFFFGSFAFWLWIVIPVILFVTGVVLRRKRILKYSDTVVMKHHKANKFAAKRLKLAASLMHKGLPEPFYEEVSRAMWGYLSDKLSIPTSQLSRENAVESLRKLGVDESLTQEVVQWLDACEYARYAPSATRMEMHDLYNAAVQLIGKMQIAIREIMKRKS